MTVLRVCFVGDSITNGTADDLYLGWPGRLCAQERVRGHDLTLYNLGVRAETTDQIRARWQAECVPRLPDHSAGALVFAFGINDTAEEDGALRCPAERSLANARAILEAARAWLPVLWIGPAPVEESMQPLTPAPGVAYAFQNDRAEALSAAYARLADTLEIPFLDVFGSLAAQPAFDASLRAGDGVHPTGDGYALIADLVANWPAWRDLMDRD